MSIRFAQGLKVLPILAPADIVDAATKTEMIDLDQVHWATLLLHFGAITCDVPTVVVKCSTAATTVSAVGIAFKYRLSADVATDTMGAISDATSDGVALGVTDDTDVLIIEIDPGALAATGTDYRYIHALITPAADTTACVVGGIAILETRYQGNTIPSST